MLQTPSQNSQSNLQLATSEYLPALLELQSRAGFNHWSEAHIAGLIDKKTVLICLHEDSHELIGFVFYRLILDEAELLNIVVNPDYRQQGWGGALLLGLLQIILPQGARQLLLEVAENNTAAIALYNKLLFKHIDTRKQYYQQANGEKIDAYIMALTFPLADSKKHHVS